MSVRRSSITAPTLNWSALRSKRWRGNHGPRAGLRPRASPLAGLTAYGAIIQTLDVAPGGTVLIHGAAGGVGALAAPLALARHARVIDTASAGHHEFLRSAGVLPVAQGDSIVGRVRALAPDGVDAVLDCVGEGVLHATAGVGSSRMRACSIADGRPGITTVFARLDSAILSRLVEVVDAGGLRVPIAATYPLAQAAAAQAALKQPHPQPSSSSWSDGRFGGQAKAPTQVDVARDLNPMGHNRLAGRL